MCALVCLFVTLHLVEQQRDASSRGKCGNSLLYSIGMLTVNIAITVVGKARRVTMIAIFYCYQLHLMLWVSGLRANNIFYWGVVFVLTLSLSRSLSHALLSFAVLCFCFVLCLIVIVLLPVPFCFSTRTQSYGESERVECSFVVEI